MVREFWPREVLREAQAAGKYFWNGVWKVGLITSVLLRLCSFDQPILSVLVCLGLACISASVLNSRGGYIYIPCGKKACNYVGELDYFEHMIEVFLCEDKRHLGKELNFNPCVDCSQSPTDLSVRSSGFSTHPFGRSSWFQMYWVQPEGEC